MKTTTRTRFTFDSEGETLDGNLFMPAAKEPAGVVVAVGPLTSVKEQAAGTYARAMAERGYAALAFDYRYFGESEGQPRQFENPDANIEDIQNAGTALLADDRLAHLPLFGLGVCFGAGPARPRRSQRSHPTAATSPCRSGRHTSSTERRAARCPTTSTATPSSRWRTACRSTRAARPTCFRCRCWSSI